MLLYVAYFIDKLKKCCNMLLIFVLDDKLNFRNLPLLFVLIDFHPKKQCTLLLFFIWFQIYNPVSYLKLLVAFAAHFRFTTC